MEAGGVLRHHRDEIAPLLPLELPKPRGAGQRHPFPGDWPKVAGQTVDQLAAALTTDIGWIRQHTEFGEAARRWSSANEPGGLLLRSLLSDHLDPGYAAA